MKRSRKAALVLMAPVTTLLLAGCGEEPEQVMVYTDSSECRAAALNGNGAEQCDADYAAAKALHPQVAPKYLDKAECENDFGSEQCEKAPQQASAGGSFFMPMMMGYMMGQMLNRGGPAGNLQQPNAAGSAAPSKVPTQPLYKSRDDFGTFRTATNTPVAKGTGLVSVKPSQMKPQVGPVVRRGGFGQQAAARSSFGG